MELRRYPARPVGCARSSPIAPTWRLAHCKWSSARLPVDARPHDRGPGRQIAIGALESALPAAVLVSFGAVNMLQASNLLDTEATAATLMQVRAV